MQITPYVGAPHGYYVVPDDRSTTGQAMFCFNRGDDIFAALDEVGRAAGQPRHQSAATQSYQQPVPTTPQTSGGPHVRLLPCRLFIVGYSLTDVLKYDENVASSYFGFTATNSSRMAAVMGAPVTPVGESSTSRTRPPLRPTSDFTRYIYTTENNSLVLLEQSIGQRKSCSSLEIEI